MPSTQIPEWVNARLLQRQQDRIQWGRPRQGRREDTLITLTPQEKEWVLGTRDKLDYLHAAQVLPKP